MPIELSLKGQEGLPDYAGDFTVTVTWSMRTGDDDKCGWCSGPSEPYVTVHASRRFRVIRPERPNGPPELPEGIMPPRIAQAFQQLDTPLGHKTALKDKATGLEWLHMDVTKDWSYNRVKAEMAPGKNLDGWRYASPEELRELFIHFFGTPDGVSRDHGLALEFQRSIGGPFWQGVLDVRPPGEAGKIGVYGVVAIYNKTDALIDPGHQGWTGGDNNQYGHYLVRRVDFEMIH